MASRVQNRPWYVDVGLKFGIPSVAAGYLMYFLVGVVNAKMDTMLQMQEAHQNTVTAKMSEVVVLLGQQNAQAKQALDQQWTQLGVQQRTCLNTSKTDSDRIACAALTGRPQ